MAIFRTLIAYSMLIISYYSDRRYDLGVKDKVTYIKIFDPKMFTFGTINTYGVNITKCVPDNCYDPGVTGRMACISDSSFCFIEGSHLSTMIVYDVKITKKRFCSPK